jgi:hypothetical protein
VASWNLENATPISWDYQVCPTKQCSAPGSWSLWQASWKALHRWKATPQDLPEKKAYRPVTLRKVAQALDSIQLKGVPAADEILTKYIVQPGDTLTKIAYELYEHWGGPLCSDRV